MSHMNTNIIPRGAPSGLVSRGGPSQSSLSKHKPESFHSGGIKLDSGFDETVSMWSTVSGHGKPSLMLPNSSAFRGGDDCTTTDKSSAVTIQPAPAYNTANDHTVNNVANKMQGIVISGSQPPTNVRNAPRKPVHGMTRTTRIITRSYGSSTVQAPSHRSSSPSIVSSTPYSSSISTSYGQQFHSSHNMQQPHSPFIDVRGMLQQNLHLFVQNKDGDTGLHLSVIHSQPDLLDRLLYLITKEPALQSVVDEQNGMYQTALHLAVHTQQIDMIRKLLLSGASLNVPDHKGNTALHIAARFGSTRSLEELALYVPLQTLLDVATRRNNEGQTCVHIAAQHGNTDILRKLKSYGVDIDMQDEKCGKTALHVSVENSSLRDIQFLLETCHAEVNTTTFTGCTALHIASGRGDIATTAYLLSQGANPYSRTDEGDTALELASSEEVIYLLQKAAALQWMY